MSDGDTLVAWVREAADELEKAHAILDAYSVSRTLNSDDGIECTLAARIALALDRYREALEWIADGTLLSDPIHREHESIKRIRKVATEALNDEGETR